MKSWCFIIKGGLFVGMAALWAFLVMILWNWLIGDPELFGGPILNYWQALGLLALSKLLFHGFGGCGGGPTQKFRKRHWKKKWSEKLANMTPEEKEKFQQEMDDCCRKSPWSS